MRQQLNEYSNIGTEFSDILDIHYLDGIHQCDAEDEEKIEPGVKAFFPGPYYEWFNAQSDPASPDGRIYKYVDESLQHIAGAAESTSERVSRPCSPFAYCQSDSRT